MSEIEKETADSAGKPSPAEAAVIIGMCAFFEKPA